MAAYLVILVILLPWLGGLAVWLVREEASRLQHGLAVGFSLLAAAASLALIGFAGPASVVRLPLGPAFGDLTFVPDGLGVTLAAIAAVIGSLAVIFSVDYMRGEAQIRRYY